MLAEGKTGPQILADGAQATARMDKTGALCTAQSHGGYTEAAYRGAIMEVCNPVAGIAPGTALSTTPPLILWNPPSSGKKLSVLKASMGYVSGTYGAGSILLAAVLSQVTVPTTGTELTPVCSLLGAPRGVGRAFAGSTLASVPQIIRPIFSFGAILATSVFQPTDCVDVLDGSIVVTPGTCLVMQGLGTAGTTPLAIFSFTWEEIPD